MPALVPQQGHRSSMQPNGVHYAVCRIMVRLKVLPLVSKRWARIMLTSAEVWREACVDLAEIPVHSSDSLRVRLDIAAMAAWFHARLGRFKMLGLLTSDTSFMPPLMTSMLLSTQAASLTHLSIHVTAYGLRGHELGVIAAIKGLTALDVHVTALSLNDWGATFVRVASRLTALYQLDLVYIREPSGLVAARDLNLPRCQELAELRSNRLEVLSVGTVCATADVLRLAGVPNLQRCHLLADSRSTAEFQIDPVSLQGCTRLSQLSLHGLQGLILEPGCFHRLSGLTMLTLTDCNLHAVPAALKPLQSLQVLNLTENPSRDVDEAGSYVLGDLEQLRLLDVAKSLPAVHSASSVQALFDLVRWFRDHNEDLHVNFDPKLSDTYEPENGYWGSKFEA